MGTLFCACLAKAGQPIDAIDVNREHVDALNRRGAMVTGTVTLNVPVHALTPEEMEGEYDLIFLLIKQTYNTSAFAHLRPHLHNKSVLCTLQNGIPEPVVAEAFGEERTLGCAVTWAATFLGPGKTRATAEKEQWSSTMGTLSGKLTEEAEEVRKILSLMCPTEFIDNLMGIRWSKLLINCSFSGMSAALGCTFGEILENEKALKCAQYIARECIRVTEVQGYEMVPMAHGKTFKTLMDFQTDEERLNTVGIYRELWGAARSAKASMLQDLEMGRQSEIDAINGLLSQKGREFGVPTPVNDTVVEIVKGIEDGQYKPAIDNLSMFTEILRLL